MKNILWNVSGTIHALVVLVGVLVTGIITFAWLRKGKSK